MLTIFLLFLVFQGAPHRGQREPQPRQSQPNPEIPDLVLFPDRGALPDPVLLTGKPYQWPQDNVFVQEFDPRKTPPNDQIIIEARRILEILEKRTNAKGVPRR
jgi:hypothetical protein